MFLLALILGASGLAQAAPTASDDNVPTEQVTAQQFSLDEILDAVRFVESGSLLNGGRNATGDGGRAIGPYQIHRGYFEDSNLDGTYADCRDPEFSRRVVIAYWKRWCPDALKRCDAQTLARVHNGGPRGASKVSTAAYWKKVEKRLSEQMAERTVAVPTAVVRTAIVGVRPLVGILPAARLP